VREINSNHGIKNRWEACSMRVGRIDSSEQSVMNPPPADHVEKSIVDFSLTNHAKEGMLQHK